MHKEKKSKNVKGCFPPKTSTLNTEKGFKGRFNYSLRTAKMMWMTSINVMQNITYGVCNKLLDTIPQFSRICIVFVTKRRRQIASNLNQENKAASLHNSLE